MESQGTEDKRLPLGLEVLTALQLRRTAVCMWNLFISMEQMLAIAWQHIRTLPAGHRPKTKVQVPVPAIDGLYFTIDTNGVVSMRNEKSTTISFGKCAMHGVITFVK